MTHHRSHRGKLEVEQGSQKSSKKLEEKWGSCKLVHKFPGNVSGHSYEHRASSTGGLYFGEGGITKSSRSSLIG